MFGLGGLGPRGSFILPAKGASVNRAAVLSCESWFKRPHQSTTRYSWKKEARALESAFNRDAVAHRLRSGRSGLCPLLRFSCSRSSSWGELASFSGGPQPNRTGRYPPAVRSLFMRDLCDYRSELYCASLDPSSQRRSRFSGGPRHS